MGNIIIAIDPGNIQSGFVVVEHDGREITRVLDKGKANNDYLFTLLACYSGYDLAIEMIASYGMAVGAGNAAGANSGIVITGLDGTPDGYEAIKDGRITGTVAQDGGLMASSGVEAAVTLLDGGTLENNLIIADSVWIDSSNVADYE